MNKHSFLFRSLSVLICVLMCVGSMSIASFADAVYDLSGELILDENLLAADKYSAYNGRYGDVPKGVEFEGNVLELDSLDDVFVGGTTALLADEGEFTNDPVTISKVNKVMPVTITGVDENGVAMADGTVYDGVEQTQTGLYLPVASGDAENCYVSFKVNIPQTGRYAIAIEYYPLVSYKQDGDATVERSGAAIERTLYVDGLVPFYEARFLTFSRVYSDVMPESYEGEREGAFQKDIADNEIRPNKIQTPRWMSAYFSDSTGNYIDPFEFYLAEGERVITLSAQKESFIVSKLKVIPLEETISYEDYAKKYSEGNVSTEAIKLEAELYTSTSDRSIYPMSDRSSAITSPQNASREVLNMMGEENWKNLMQWASWTVEVPETGYYKIAVRYRQNINDGLFSSRVLRVNGEIPFEEAKYLQFDYGDVWQSEYLNNGSEEYADGFLIYLKEGKNTISLEANLGNMAEVIRELSEVITTINASYIDILKITGNQPDANRDYGFYGLIPDSIDDLADASEKLYDIAEELTAISGKSSNITTLENVARRLHKMGNKEDEVAKNMSGLKGDIGSLGTWLQTAMTQPLTFDYISIQSGDSGEDDLPQANENFLESLW